MRVINAEKQAGSQGELKKVTVTEKGKREDDQILEKIAV